MLKTPTQLNFDRFGFDYWMLGIWFIPFTPVSHPTSHVGLAAQIGRPPTLQCEISALNVDFQTQLWGVPVSGIHQ